MDSIGVNFDGFDDLNDMIKNMEVTPEDEKRAMKKALEPVNQKIIDNTPVRTSKTKKETKMTVKIKDFAVIGTIKVGTFYGGFLNFGTSKDKSHVGYFDNAVHETTDEAIQAMAEELLKKVK